VHLELASDELTGAQIGDSLSKAAGRRIAYSRFPDEMLKDNPFIGGLTALLDLGPLAGNADLKTLREINPTMQSFDTWLAGSGHDGLEKALRGASKWTYHKSA
jgi:hypothetical protein